MRQSFDVIGDIHGQYDKLVGLLALLGYRESAGTWRHADRMALFLGDLIDRGPRQLDTVNVVRRMVDAGAARCLLGNHEFNAISWVTENDTAPGAYLRPHTPENLRQHGAFLAEVAGKPVHNEIVAWFMTLPLWVDLNPLRVIHACWHGPSMVALRPYLGPSDTLTEELLRVGNRHGHPAYSAIEVLCKGPEAALPEGLSFQDKEGKVRHDVRLRWWSKNLRTFRDAAIVMRGDGAKLPDALLPAEVQSYAYHGPPVIFGHYWFDGPPQVISPQFACVDFSAAASGPLVAYRWDGEPELSDDKLMWSSAHGNS